MKLIIDIPKHTYDCVIGKTVLLSHMDGMCRAIENGTSVDYINNYIKQKIDYLENLASIETNEGRWREEEKYLYAISVLEEVVEYINTSGGDEDEDGD